jgi:hypothetical protein
MLGYHGTTAARAHSALSGGLAPSICSGVPTNFPELPSRSDRVYLTTLYAGYFALRAAETTEERAIIEIELDLLDKELLLPDEDHIERQDRVLGLCFLWDQIEEQPGEMIPPAEGTGGTTTWAMSAWCVGCLTKR